MNCGQSFHFLSLFCHLPTVGPVCSPFMPASLTALSHFFFFFLIKEVIFKLYTQRGAWTYSPEIKSRLLYWLSQPNTSQATIWKENLNKSMKNLGSFFRCAQSKLSNVYSKIPATNMRNYLLQTSHLITCTSKNRNFLFSFSY